MKEQEKPVKETKAKKAAEPKKSTLVVEKGKEKIIKKNLEKF